MKAEVNESCIGCGLCACSCSKVFRMNDIGKAEVRSERVDPDLEDFVREAAEACPVNAIVVLEGP